MFMPRIKKPVSYALDPKLVDRLEKWLARQSPAVKKTAAVETALGEFLDRQEGKAKK